MLACSGTNLESRDRNEIKSRAWSLRHADHPCIDVISYQLVTDLRDVELEQLDRRLRQCMDVAWAEVVALERDSLPIGGIPLSVPICYQGA